MPEEEKMKMIMFAKKIKAIMAEANYVTLQQSFNHNEYYTYCIYEKEPFWNGIMWEGQRFGDLILKSIVEKELLDLSDYVDENGRIDFSKCIVDVSDKENENR